uniref:Uncharacterized protein n=1 Tax=Klebsiella pneumoniae TaxID=573 RepID=A0A8D6SZR8_KLEPN
MILLTKRIRYTFLRDSIYYIQFCLPDGKMFRRSLNTDSHREASVLMIALMPFILQVKNRQLTPEALCLQLNALNTNRMLERAARAFPLSMPLSLPPEKQIEQKKGLHLGEAWAQYKHERGKGWTAAIHSANERYMEVLLTILGDDRDVATITKRDIKQVMEVVEGLPKRVILNRHG